MLKHNRAATGAKKNTKILHGNYAKVDSHAEITSAFINQAITQVDYVDNGTPIPSEADVLQAKNWVDENHK